MTNLYIIFLLFLILIQFILFNIKIHPIHLIIFLVFYTLNICLFIASWNNNYIYPIIIFLIIIRGLLIVFLYFSRISAIDNYYPKINTFFITTFLLYIIILFILIINSNKFYPLKPLNLESINLINIFNYYSNLRSLYSPPYINLTLLSILFLLLRLFTIIKICRTKYASLRKIK